MPFQMKNFPTLTNQKDKIWLQSELLLLLCRSIPHKEKAFLQDSPQITALKDCLSNLLEQPEECAGMIPCYHGGMFEYQRKKCISEFIV